MADNPRPSAPAPRSSPSDAQCVAAMREFSAQKGESHDAMWDQVSAEDRAEIISEWRAILECAQVAFCGERGGGLDPATIEACAKVCEDFANQPSGGLEYFDSRDTAGELATRIRALSSSPSTE